MLKPLFPETHNLVRDWYIFIHYLLLTVYGFALASSPARWDWLARSGGRALAIALATSSAPSRCSNPASSTHDTPADSLLANAFTWTWMMAFLGYGRRT